MGRAFRLSAFCQTTARVTKAFESGAVCSFLRRRPNPRRAPMKQGIFLINLGSPDSPTKEDVRTYLDEFLMDPRVVDLPKVFRRCSCAASS